MKEITSIDTVDSSFTPSSTDKFFINTGGSFRQAPLKDTIEQLSITHVNTDGTMEQDELLNLSKGVYFADYAVAVKYDEHTTQVYGLFVVDRQINGVEYFTFTTSEGYVVSYNANDGWSLYDRFLMNSDAEYYDLVTGTIIPRIIDYGYEFVGTMPAEYCTETVLKNNLNGIFNANSSITLNDDLTIPKGIISIVTEKDDDDNLSKVYVYSYIDDSIYTYDASTSAWTKEELNSSSSGAGMTHINTDKSMTIDDVKELDCGVYYVDWNIDFEAYINEEWVEADAELSKCQLNGPILVTNADYSWTNTQGNLIYELKQNGDYYFYNTNANVWLGYCDFNPVYWNQIITEDEDENTILTDDFKSIVVNSLSDTYQSISEDKGDESTYYLSESEYENIGNYIDAKIAAIGNAEESEY